jgi:NAD(P)-dependent dehydrogenase (short-subunit alcohol dehydrogenase family)
MDLELSGRRALVTGGSSGIGRAIALQLAREGCDVALVARTQDRLDAAAREIAAETGRTIVAVRADTGADEDVARMAEEAAAGLGGHVEVLVNCAATANTGAPMTEDRLEEEVNVKVRGYLRTARALAPAMAEAGWGRIVNVSGLAARQAGTVVGSVRNVAVAALTKNLADELGSQGINVTVVHPGMTLTERSPEGAAERGGGTVIGRIVTAAEVADVVAFLASPRSVAIAGDAIAAGGGAKGPIYY